MKWRPKFSLLTLLLLTVLAGCGLLLWRDWAPWRLEREIKLGHSRETEYIAMRFSPDMQWMLLGTARKSNARGFIFFDKLKTLEVWDLRHGKIVCDLRDEEEFTEFAISADGAYAATLSGKFLRIWKMIDGELVGAVPLQEGGYNQPVFSSDSKRIVAGNLVWELGSRNEPLTLGSPSPGGVMTGSMAEALEAKISNRAALADSATTLREFQQCTRDVYVNVVASRSGRWLLTSVKNTRTQLWDLISEKKVGEISETINWPSYNYNVRFSEDDSHLVLTINRNLPPAQRESLITELPSGRHVGKIPGETRVESYDLNDHFSGNGERLVFEDRQSLFLWLSGDFRRRLAPCLSPFSLSPDGTRASVRRWDHPGEQYVCILDTELGHTLAELRHGTGGHGDEVQLFSPDGQRLYTNAVDSILVWRRVRPEMQWGIVCLPEFWAMLVCACAVAWSLRRDRRLFR